MPDPANHPLAPPRLTIVIVNYNGWDDVARLADSLSRSPAVGSGLCNVVVVDNASDGPIPEFFRAIPPGLRLVLRTENGGFAAGVNAGCATSNASWFLLLNPDVEAGADLPGRILARIEHFERRAEGPPGLVGFALKNPDGTDQPSVGVDPGLIRALAAQFIPRSRRNYQSGWRTRPGPVAWMTGACLLVDGALMRSLGGMDEEFFLYYEEVALCRSARARGRSVEFDDSVAVVHLRPLQNRPITPKMRVIIRHAKLLFFRKHQARWEFLALCGIVALEARVRAWIAGRRGDRAAHGAWKAIGGMARSMRRGAKIAGREALLLAESASDDGPGHPAHGLRGPIGRSHKAAERPDRAR